MTGDSLAKMHARSDALLPQFPFQELRLDYLPDPLAAIPMLFELLRSPQHRTLLATCRRKVNGGHFDGDATAETAVLSAAARAGCALVDLSIETAEELGVQAVLRLRQAGARVLLSFHNFKAASDPETVYLRMRRFQPDICKIVPTAGSLADNLALLGFLASHRAADEPGAVGMLMGEAGVPSRVLGLRAGGAFTFASATLAEATAPGQIDGKTMRELFHAERLDANTEVFGVAGDPIASSKSPIMHNAAFQHTSRNAVYLPLLTRDATDLFRFASELPLAGFSVTMPLKQAVLPLLNRIDPLAAKIGAVNTARREPDGSFSGFNTDVAGIVGPLAERLSLDGARVLVLGAGGAARAAVFACAGRGARVSILNRTYSTAAQLAMEADVSVMRDRELAASPAFDVLINATPAGMRGNTWQMPLPLDQVRVGLVFDTVYNPLETPLLREARARGLGTISGLEMFVRQGAEQFQLWTGTAAPVDVMRAAVLRALDGSGGD